MSKYSLFILFILLLGFLCFLLQTPGFDLYSHVINTYFYDSSEYESNLVLFGRVVPRYFLLSNIYKMTRIIGIPTGIVAYFLWTIPVLSTLRIHKGKYISTLNLIFCLFSLYVATRYSGIYLTFLYAIYFLRTHAFLSYLGFLFHPFAPVIYIILFVFDFRNLKKNFFGVIKTLIIYIFSSFILYQLLALPLTDAAARYEISMDTDLWVLFELFRVKLPSLIRFFIFVPITIIFYNYFVKKTSYTIGSAISILCLFVISIIFFIVAYEKTSMLFVFLDRQYDLFYISFLDWFDRSSFLNHGEFDGLTNRHVYLP